jgi:hypothetical protein
MHNNVGIRELEETAHYKNLVGFWSRGLIASFVVYETAKFCHSQGGRQCLTFANSSSDCWSAEAGGALSRGGRRTTGDRQGRVIGGGRVMVQLRGISGLFSMQPTGLAGSKLL